MLKKNIFYKMGFAKINIKVVIAFVVGALLFGGSVFAATIISSSEVSYTSNGNSSVKDAIDDLYSISSSWINPIYINFGTLDTNVKQTILASSDGVCLKRNGKVSCFKRNNWNVEKNHIKEVFSDVGAWNDSTRTGCNDYLSGVYCADSDFSCAIDNVGIVHCTDLSDNSDCYSYGNGDVLCTKALGMQMNSAKTIVATSAGVMFKRSNGNVYFLGINNYNYEKDHIQSVFSDVTCSVDPSYVICSASDLECHVHSYGAVYCRENNGYTNCTAHEDGSTDCS